MADPKIKYDIEANVTGAATVDELATHLEDMAKILGADLAPTAQKASTQLRELAQQQAAIDAFKRLSAEAKATEQELSLAQKSAKSYGVEIAAAGVPTAAQAATLATLNDKVQTSSVKLAEQKTAVNGANQELLKYGLTGDRIIEAQKQTSASVDALKTSVNAAIPGFKDLGSNGATSAKQLSDAWTTLGVKSLQATQAEIARINAALNTVKANSKDPLEIKMATQAAEASIARLEGGVAKVASTSTGAAEILRTLGPLMAASFGAQQFIDTITSAESLTRSYEQIFGSMSRAREEMDFIKGTANRLGLETMNLAKSYQSLAASTKGTALEGEATRLVFESVSRAMATLGKSSEETDRALTAISQMASKGTVSMEELRGQLGEALPGAMKAAADGAGITVAQLVEMVSSGEVLARDIIPALTKGLDTLYANGKPPDTVISEWNRFKNVVTDTATALGEGGGTTALGTVARFASRTLLGLKEAAFLSADAVGQLAGAASELSISQFDLSGQLDASATRIRSIGAESTNAAGAVEKLGNDSKDAFQKLGNSTAVAAESALQILQRYTDLKKDSAEYVAQVEKEIAARSAEGMVLTQLVGVYGNETEKRQMAVNVTQSQADASTKLASARNTEALVAQSYVLKLQEMALATKDVTEETKKAIAEAQKSALAKQTEFERSAALAKAKRIDAEATKAQAQAMQDNSAKVGEYQAAMQAAAKELERILALKKQGKATDEQVTDAQSKLSAATLLYRDALNDATKSAEAKIATEQRAATLAQAGISVEKERVKAAIEVAVAQGDTAKATRLQTEATQVDVRSSQEAADAYRKEAQAILGKAAAKEKEYAAQGPLTAAQKEEIDALRQSAQLKEIDAQKADILTGKILALAQANRSEASSLESRNTAQERANAATQQAIDLENKRLGRDKEGFATDKSGNRIAAGGDLTTLTGVASFLKSAGVADEAKARSLAKEFADSQGNITYMNNPGQKKYGGDTISMALLHAAEQYTFGIGGNNNSPSGATTIPEQSKSATYVSNITIPGIGTTKLTFADASSQSAGEDLLRKLAQAKSSSGY